MSFEPDDIVAAMTREELLLYRALGGQLSGVQQQRLLRRSMRVVEWHATPASPGVVAPAADVLDLERRVRAAERALCPAAIAAPPATDAPPPPQQRTVFAKPRVRKPRPVRGMKLRPGEHRERPIECVENPDVWFRSLRRAAAVLGVPEHRLTRAVKWGTALAGRHWRRRRVDEQGRRLAC